MRPAYSFSTGAARAFPSRFLSPGGVRSDRNRDGNGGCGKFRTLRKAGDLEGEVPGSASRRSRLIRDLLDRSLLTQADEGPRFYRLSLARGPLAGRLIGRLDHLGMLPRMLSDD